MGNGTPVIGRLGPLLLVALVALIVAVLARADTTDWRARYQREHQRLERLLVAKRGHQVRARRRLVLYRTEHGVSTRLGRRVRALRADVRELRAELEQARHVQAHTSRRSSASPAGGGWPAHYQQWLCIHRYEGAWDANTGNGYYGGLQMDIAFQQAYGPELLRAKGTADHWTPLEQMQVAERAYASGRGFSPWPNTASMCGLS